MSKFDYYGTLTYEEMLGVIDDVDFELAVEAHNEDLIRNYNEYLKGMNKAEFKQFFCDLLEIPQATEREKVIELLTTYINEKL